MNQLVIEAKLENMGAVLRFVEAQLEGCPMKAQNQVAIAVDEIFSNIARYAYGAQGGCVEVRVQVGDEIIIEFADTGVAYNPLTAPPPDVSASAEQRELGGLGIFLVKNLMDSIEYRREGDKNSLTLRKKLGN